MKIVLTAIIAVIIVAVSVTFIYPRLVKPIDLPKFNTSKQLASSQWLKYLQEVYGNDLSKIKYPLNLKEFDVLYTDKLDKAGIKHSIVRNPFCPVKEFQLTTRPGSGLLPPTCAQIFKKIKRKAVPSNTWIEVTHGGSGASHVNVGSADQLTGNWLYVAKGSGIYFYTGKTRAYATHEDAVMDLLGEPCKNNYGSTFKFWPRMLKDKLSDECEPQWDRMVKEASRRKYNSIQFINHIDLSCYGDDFNQFTEIIDCNPNADSSYVCGYRNPNTDDFKNNYKTGLNATKPCNCSNHALPNQFVGYLHCQSKI